MDLRRIDAIRTSTKGRSALGRERVRTRVAAKPGRSGKLAAPDAQRKLLLRRRDERGLRRVHDVKPHR
jgi:hypothetical protein